MNNYEVCVIVPVYNLENYISSTLDSIINQKFKDYEIIVVDDGSTDNSLQIIKNKLKNSNIPNKIIHQKNKGVSSARNKAIEASSSKYLVFVDGDDIISENHLKELYNNINSHDFSITQLVKKEGQKISKPFSFNTNEMTTKEFIRKELLMEIPFNFCQIMYKTDLIKKNNIKFPENIIYGEDTYFALKSLIYGKKIAISNEVTYYYTQHSTSAIKTSQLKRFEIVNVFEKLRNVYMDLNQKELADLIITSRIPKAIFGNMNYFFYNSYDYDEIMNKMHELDLFNKLSKFKGNVKFKFKIKLFLLSPKTYYRLWMKFKNSID